MIYFTCTICRTALTADEQYAGQRMRCPTCMSAQPVPSPGGQSVAVGAGAMSTGASGEVAAPPRRPSAPPRIPQLFHPTGGGRRYGFNCPHCSSRLEATEAQAATEGQCPTCGSSIVIPILDRYGRLIDPVTKQIIKQDPHPVHAYAAAGARAPRIIRVSDGSQHIQCPRCSTYSAISANNCRQCGMPFTMEGTTAEAAGATNGFCVASLVLGIVGMLTFCIGIVPALAIVFGIIGYNQVNNAAEARGKGMAIAGMILGGIGAILALLTWFN